MPSQLREEPLISRSLANRKERIAQLARLKDGWHDGEGISISKAAIESAEKLLELKPDLAAKYSIFPTDEGGLLFDFDTKRWLYDIEIFPNGLVEISGVRLDETETMSTERTAVTSDAFTRFFDLAIAQIRADHAPSTPLFF